jgi:o-succinylbenzoate---CoA ligase
VSRLLRDVPADAAHLLDLLPGALDGSGPALRVRPGSPSRDTGLPDEPVTLPAAPDDVALAVATSGSTGTPRTTLLTAGALTASARATHDRLAGPGQWLLVLPVDHVAGLQVLVRSVLAGTTPVIAPPGRFTPALLVDAAARLTGPTRYTSLVPTQLVRVLDDPAATRAAASFDAILLGGSAAPAPLLARARAAGLRLVTTYGMTETCGGCVYDGVPLDGVRVRIDDDGRVLIAGDVLAAGYLEHPSPFVERAGERHLRTGDLGRIDDGVLTVLGRADDVILTGGVNVAPAAVEDALVGLPSVAEACVVGLPDEEWGELVAALVVPVPGATVPALPALRDHVAARLGPAHAPRRVVVVDALPLRGPGKPDRAAARLVAAAGAELAPEATTTTAPRSRT